ncbi:STAS domain-containing protein [Trichlorobacter lovleyi]|uniref:STAS domain-containing protein n=1 Tax=Trichlorobacter lovleyi TaxID=313985 RepID=UPI00223F8003|nr:STAS domain-containing protein [Trichlorobacter lovleyi]QOX79409.1 STAS domain-containing protein [Trichlorobacter lovleyi]
MESTIRFEGGVGVISLTGRLDSGAAPLFDLWFVGQDKPECRFYLLEMSAMTYITSAGLRSILKICKVLEARGGRLAACAMTGPVRDLFKIAGFNQFVALYDGLDEGLAALSA